MTRAWPMPSRGPCSKKSVEGGVLSERWGMVVRWFHNNIRVPWRLLLVRLKLKPLEHDEWGEDWIDW